MEAMVDFRPRLMTVPQAAKYAAESRATLYKEWKKGNIEFLKMGGSTRIETSELDRYIDTKAKPAAQ